MRFILTALLCVLPLSFAACSSSSTPVAPVTHPQATISVGFNSPDPAIPPTFGASPAATGGANISFTLTETHYTGNFVVAPPAGGTCLAVTGSGTTFAASADACHTFPAGANFVVTDTNGVSVNMAVNATSTTQTFP